jgi:hypothetical protein
MRAIITAAVLGLTLVEASAPLHAQEWRTTIERNCVKQIGEQGGHWPAWSKCVAQHLWGWDARTQAAYRECVKPIRQRIMTSDVCNNCEDEDLEVISCMSGKLGAR